MPAEPHKRSFIERARSELRVLPPLSRPACLSLLILSLFAGQAHAMYKCVGPNGNSWSDRPCAGGGGTPVTPAAAPDPAAVKAATRRAEMARAEEKRLTRERDRQLAAEQSARSRAEAGRREHEKKCRHLEMKMRWSEEDARRAAPKQEAQARRTAGRKLEQFELECGRP